MIRLPPHHRWLLLGFVAGVLPAMVAAGIVLLREQHAATPPASGASMRRQYLIDFENLVDAENGFATLGHLLIYNPGQRDANVTLTVYYEDREPTGFQLQAPARTSTETNSASWSLLPNCRCALQVDSSQPVICQATVGWNNSANDYRPRAATKSPHGVRETAKSYMAIPALARIWYLADALVIDDPDQFWIKESEWAVLLNPGDQLAQVTLALHGAGGTRQHTVEVSPRRVRAVFMDPIAAPNSHYGVTFTSDRPVAAQWLRAVNWYDSKELMAFWSVPCVPLPSP
jgi:hypothetical protein